MATDMPARCDERDDAYSRAGVDQGAADSAVAGLVRALRGDRARPALAQVPLPGHYASVIRIDERTGIALSTDGVGTKLLVAEQLGRFDTVGIDCVAMNVNDVICVGAEPLAMLDYIAVERPTRRSASRSASAWRAGPSWPGSRSPAASWPSSATWSRGVDLSGACFGTVALDAIVDGSAVRPGDAVIGLPSSGLHSNGYTLARAALEGLAARRTEAARPAARRGAARADRDLRQAGRWSCSRSEIEVRGLAHITSGGLGNLLRLAAEVGYEIDDPLPVPPIFELIRERGDVSDEEMHEVFNMGCGFCASSPPRTKRRRSGPAARATTLRRSGSASRCKGRTGSPAPERESPRAAPRNPSTDTPPPPYPQLTTNRWMLVRPALA